MNRFIAFFAVIFIACGIVNGGVQIFDNRSAWEAAVGNFLQENFDDGVLGFGINVVSTLPVAGIRAGVGILGPDNVYYDQLSEVSVWGPRRTTWSFDNDLYGFGANWDMSIGGAGTNIQVFLNGTAVSQEIPNTYNGGFWGVTSDVSFNTVLLTAGSVDALAEAYEMDDMVISPVPIPGAFMLGVIGLMGIAGAKKRKYIR